MHNISKESFVATNVLMAFEDGSVSFCIPEGATLADISENLDKVGKWHGKLLSVDVRFNAPDKSVRPLPRASVDIGLGVSIGQGAGSSHRTVRSFSVASASLISQRKMMRV